MAVKIVERKFIAKNKLENTLKQELAVTFNDDFNHPNIAKGINVLFTKEILYQLYEFCEG